MENKQLKNNVTEEDLVNKIESCSFEPKQRSLLLTVNSYIPEEDIEYVNTEDVTIDSWQYIIATGKGSAYKAGDKVYLDLQKLVKRIPDGMGGFSQELSLTPYEDGENIFTILDEGYVLGKQVESVIEKEIQKLNV